MNFNSILIVLLLLTCKTTITWSQGFSPTTSNWNVPGIGTQDYRFFHQYARHYVIDMNGDGLPDFVYSEDPNNSNSTWVNGSQKYWKVYLNTGSGFASTATNWNVPGIGTQDYRFLHQYARHHVIDMNGDGLPDFVYSEDPNNSNSTWVNGSQKYWKVYLNTGSGFASTATNWNVPGIGTQDYRFFHQYARHHVIDMNGDGLPDFVYSDDPNNSNSTWVNGSQKYWKVYLNTGSGFASTVTNWNMPGIGTQDYRFFHQYARHHVIDMNGDGLPDFVYSDDPNNSNSTWVNGSQKYWKVYLNISPLTSINRNTDASTLIEVKIYPNPASDFIFLEKVNTEEAITVNLINTLGQVVNTVTVNTSKYQIPIKDLKTGIYIINIETETGEHLSKGFVKK